MTDHCKTCGVVLGEWGVCYGCTVGKVDGCPQWIPVVGQVLKHRKISQTIEIRGTMTVEGLPPFWEVRLHGAYGDPKPWMIVETALVEQYELRK